LTCRSKRRNRCCLDRVGWFVVYRHVLCLKPMSEEKQVEEIPALMINPATGRAIRTDSNRNRALLNLPPLPARKRGRPRKKLRTPTPEKDSSGSEHDDSEVEDESEAKSEPENEKKIPDKTHDAGNDEMVHSLLQETQEHETVAHESVAKPVPIARYTAKPAIGLTGLTFPRAYSAQIQKEKFA